MFHQRLGLICTLATSLMAAGCEQSPPKLAPAPVSKKPVRADAASTPTTPALSPATNPADALAAKQALDKGIKQWLEGDRDNARTSFLLATKKDDTLGPAHTWLGLASALLGNLDGAYLAAARGLELAKTPDERAQALFVLSKTSPQDAPRGPYQGSGLLQAALRNDPEQKAIKVMVPELKLAPSLISGASALNKAPKPSCELPSPQPKPAASMSALCDQIAAQIKQDQGLSPGPCRTEVRAVKSPKGDAEAEVVSLELEGQRHYWAVMRRVESWSGAELLRTGHGMDGHIHEGVEFEIKNVGEAEVQPFWLNINVKFKRGAEDSDLGTFYRTERHFALLCKAGAAPKCLIQHELERHEHLLTQLFDASQGQRYVTAWTQEVRDFERCVF